MTQTFERDLLRSGLDQLKLSLTSQQQDQLMDYLQLFAKWNQAYNLSAVRLPADMVRRHLLDSLAAVPFVVGRRLIDVGTGGGLPGIPLAIAYPDRQVGLLDSAGKKTRFLHQVKTQLGLTNVHIINARCEGYKPEQLYDGVISRAFASLADFTRVCRHLLSADGCLWAMKGQYPAEELRAVEGTYQLLAHHALQVPGLAEERCLLQLKPLSLGS